MTGDDLVVEHGTSDGRPHVFFRRRSDGRPVVYFVAACKGVGHGGHDVVAHAWLACHGRWFWIRADGSTSSPGFEGPWLGWLLDLAMEHGWEP